MEQGEIYHVYQGRRVFKVEDYKRESDLILARFLTRTAKYLFLVGVLVLLIFFAPSIWYYLKGGIPNNISELLARTAKEAETAPITVKPAYQPKLDATLPQESRLKIVSAKIDTQINEATLDNYEEALRKGVWRVSDFGTPADRSKPVILAAHRYGYLAWSIPYRLKNSFYNLPKLKTGDTVEIIWRQRKYIYEVYREEDGETITDYSADLILYTCESLNSPVRIFRYARLLEI
ncbi:hypothetical protein A2V56_01860 [Candidatus Woesebacteria bacterium RBG_19FT_COMBO_42_9]|uniref:Sortase n=1 Tax=Candidatus Woesebacteria bacterium RBG_16_42_24 TaxID=1802485 RepID=A0A1F7XKU6_9BACT|nr:MAG: hypothetical protein A2V97_02695 [Candidatus Woesebacteria bacterium RBG_16_42_24]OGM17062.1 MAG: hypothetical protein A2V56_01860 [Candidatus Woesebacteria bacterium RBG_19FT_COMBO_42_9]OGM66905.1 MAG: hypothetical protein A2985_01860 [Candidatus Woesebacteria bacterium RIFCSPLOWO2_01_FULL_43_11]